MKSSRYNLFVNTVNGARLAFNSASAALAEIDAGTHTQVIRLLADPSSAESSTDRAIVGALVEGKYLVEDSADELESLRARNRARRLSGAAFSLTIAPSLACNFQCPYCFERPQTSRMTPDTEAALIRFSRPFIEKSKDVLITWFGGEPTLCLGTIERIQTHLSELTLQYGSKLHRCSIVTNGYLLDGAAAERLRQVGVIDAQVTLDGPQAIHDTRRTLRGGRGTYGRIMGNLAEASEALDIVIRINIDQANADTALEVLEDLDRHGLRSRVRVYFAQVNPAEGVCADVRDRCFTTEEFSRFQVELYRTLIEHGFYGIEYPALAPGGHCGADSATSFVVAPNGLLFKCWEELSLDTDRSVGSIFDAATTPEQCANADRYSSWDPFTKSECVDCHLLPICMGGCPLQGMKQDDKDCGYCCTWKYNLNEMLQLRHQCDLRREVRT